MGGDYETEGSCKRQLLNKRHTMKRLSTPMSSYAIYIWSVRDYIHYYVRLKEIIFIFFIGFIYSYIKMAMISVDIRKNVKSFLCPAPN